MATVDRGGKALVEAKLMRAPDARAARKRVEPTRDLGKACAGAQLLVECVTEDPALKRRLFKRFDQLCPKRAVLASNMSGLSIMKIAAASGRPTKVAGMHFWNPLTSSRWSR